MKEAYAWHDYWQAYARGDEQGMKEAFSRIHLTEPASMTKTTVRMKIPYYEGINKETPK